MTAGVSSIWPLPGRAFRITMNPVMPMRAYAKKLRRSIETMPRHAYIFLKWLLILAAGMLTASALLYALGESLEARRWAVTLLETPAGVLLVGAIGLALLLDRNNSI